MSQKHEYSFASNQDQLPLHVCLMEPAGKAVGIVEIAHGMSEHKKRYYPFMEYLCHHGYVCVIHDHRGHGGSVRSEADYGYMYEEGAKNLIRDLHQISIYVRERYKGLPFYLFGHSMGSLVARGFLKNYSKVLDGLMVCGSPSANPVSMPAGKMLELLMKKQDSRHRSQRLHQLVFGSFNKRFQEEGSPNAWICSNKDVVREYDEDAGCGFVFTLNGFYNLFELMSMVYSKKDWKSPKKELPIWFLSGEEDPCMVSRAKFMQAISLLQYVGYENVTYCLYPGMRHEILNETDNNIVYRDILQKLDSWSSKKES